MGHGFGDDAYEEEYQVGGSLDRGGKFLEGDHPGCYHMIVTRLNRPAVDKEGMPIEDALASVSCIVAAPKEHAEKTWDMTLWLPKLDGKDGGAFGQKKNDRFLAAIGAITQDHLSKKVRINWSGLAGRQFLVRLESTEIEIKRGKNKGQKRKVLQVAFADFFHVDDPDAGTDYPRSEQALKLLPASLRRVEDKKQTKNVDDMDI